MFLGVGGRALRDELTLWRLLPSGEVGTLFLERSEGIFSSVGDTYRVRFSCFVDEGISVLALMLLKNPMVSQNPPPC